MQDPPDKQALLDAVARLLTDDRWKTALSGDPALLFRVRIAAHLVETVSRELAREDAHDRAELARLEPLLGQPLSPETLAPEARRRRILELNRALAARLAAGDDRELRARALPCLQATLIDKLSVTQPRFDTSREIE